MTGSATSRNSAVRFADPMLAHFAVRNHRWFTRASGWPRDDTPATIAPGLDAFLESVSKVMRCERDGGQEA
jgi:hypothetical protein